MTAVILAAGLSRRFSGKKLLMKINEKPMVTHVADLVDTMDFTQKIIVYSDNEVLESVTRNNNSSCNFQPIYNKYAKKGLSTSVNLSVEASLSDSIIFFMGDQPFIDEDTVNKLVKAFYKKEGSIIVPIYEGRRGNPVIFSNKWFEDLKKLEGDVGGREIINKNLDDVYEVKIENSKIGLDIDTQEDFLCLIK